jgi:hypothetical protein
VAKLLETVQLVSKRINPKLKVSGIVLTMFDSNTKLSAEVVNELNNFIVAAKGKPLPWSNTVIFKSKIRRNIKLAESPSFGQTIIAYEPQSNGAFDYRALAKEVAAMSDPKLAAALAAEAAAAPVKAATIKRAPAPVVEPVDAVAAPAPVAAAAPVVPAAAPAPAIAPERPAIEVTINPNIDPSKLAAAKVELPEDSKETEEAAAADAEATMTPWASIEND